MKGKCRGLAWLKTVGNHNQRKKKSKCQKGHDLWRVTVWDRSRGWFRKCAGFALHKHGPSDYLFWFSIGSNVMGPRSGDGRFIGWIRIFAIGCGGGGAFPNFEVLDAKIAPGHVVGGLLRPWSYTCRVARQISSHLISSHLISSHLISSHPKFPVQEEGQSRGAESPKGGSVLARKADRLHDQRLVSSYWCSWYSVGLCWFIHFHPSWW